MKIRHHSGEFCIFNNLALNKAIEDIKDLTSLGILSYLCSYPDGTIFDKYSLRNHFTLSKYKFSKAMKILKEKKYIYESDDERICLVNDI